MVLGVLHKVVERQRPIAEVGEKGREPQGEGEGERFRGQAVPLEQGEQLELLGAGQLVAVGLKGFVRMFDWDWEKC